MCDQCICVYVYMQMLYKRRVRQRGISLGILRDSGVGERQGSCEVPGAGDGQEEPGRLQSTGSKKDMIEAT